MIGIDICETNRFIKLSQNEEFLARIFTPAEIEYCGKGAVSNQRFAARFAAKEAFSKAVGTGLGKNVHLNEIEIIKNEAGQPTIRLHGTTSDFFSQTFPNKTINLSISHEKTVAVAVVVLL